MHPDTRTPRTVRGRLARQPILAAGLSLLAACTSWPKPRPEVDVALRALRETEVVPADPIESELLELAGQIRASGEELHVAALLHTGADALTSRVHLIRAARQTVDVQTFNWVADDAGVFLLEELLAAARRGVQVRL